MLGLDIGGTKSAVVIGTAQGEIIARAEWPSEAERGPEAMLCDFEAKAKKLILAYPDIHAAVSRLEVWDLIWSSWETWRDTWVPVRQRK